MVITFFIDTKSNYYALIALSIFWIYNKRYKQSIKVLKHSSIFLSLCIYIAFLIASFLYTEDFSYGLRALEKKSGLIILPILLTGLQWNKSLKEDVLKLFVFTLFILTVYSLITTFIKYEIGSDISYFSWILPFTSSFSANYYSLFLAFGILIIVFEFRQFQSLLSAPITIAFIVYLGAFLPLLTSRSAILGLIAILLMYAIFKISKSANERKKGFTVLVLTFLMLVVVLSTVPYLNTRIKQSIFHFSADPRYKLFKSTVNVFLRNPLLGVGIGDVQDELTAEHLRTNNVEAYTNKYNAHNDWLQIVLGTGLVGLVFFSHFFLQLIKKAWRTRDLYMVTFVLFFLITSMTQSILERNKGIIFFSFFTTLFFILNHNPESLIKTSTGDSPKKPESSTTRQL